MTKFDSGCYDMVLMGEKSLQEAVEEYRTVHLPARNLATRTRREYLDDIDDLVGFLEDVAGIQRVAELRLAPLERFLAQLEERGLAGSTRRRKALSIRSFLRFLYRQELISTDLARQLIPPFAGNPEPRFLTQAEYQRLQQACKVNPRDAAIIELLLQTGIRLSELNRLTIDDVDLSEEPDPDKQDSGVIRVNGGGSRKSRAIPLNARACFALVNYLKTRPKVSRVLFLNRFWRPLGLRGIEKVVAKYARIAGIAGASVHSLRHTFGTQHAARGTTIKTLQEVMGHQDIRATEIYTHLAQEIMRKELQEHAL